MEILISLLPWLVAFPLGGLFYTAWQRERRIDREMQERQIEIEMRRAEEERHLRWTQEKRQEESEQGDSAGTGSGGYIIVDLPNDKRSLFQDLLKGFEEYAQLKGYSVSFSVDTTFTDKVAFKFTLTESGIVVGAQRVRDDFKEYMARVRNGDPLDDIPVIASIEEHELLVTTLKNRISFLQHSYNLSQNSISFYEGLMRRASSMAVLPSQNVVVQTGGALTSSNYTASNSPHALVGNDNRSDHSISIADSFNKLKLQIEGIEHVLELLRAEKGDENGNEAIRNLENVKEELEQSEAPDPSRVSRWLENTKQAIQAGSLGHETVQAAKELLKLFGL